MKIFWKPLPRASPSQPPLTLPSLETLALSPSLFDCLRDSLEESKDLLPASARMFGDWEIGLLERFSYKDVGIEITSPGVSESGGTPLRLWNTRMEIPIEVIPNSSALME